MTRTPNSQPPVHGALEQVEAQASFILDHPAASEWLKRSLQGALRLDPIEALNDLEILSTIIRARSQLLITEPIERFEDAGPSDL